MANIGEVLEQEAFTIGRAGLKVPEIEWRRGYAAANIADFFHTLWAINSEYPHKFYDSYHRFKESTLRPAKELVLPATDSRPLVVLRGKYEPQELVSKELGLTGLSRSVGTETHSVLIPPMGLGRFAVFAELKSSPHSSRYEISTNEDYIVEKLEYEFEGSSSMTVKEQVAAAKDEYEQALQHVLGDVKELLS